MLAVDLDNIYPRERVDQNVESRLPVKARTTTLCKFNSGFHSNVLQWWHRHPGRASKAARCTLHFIRLLAWFQNIKKARNMW